MSKVQNILSNWTDKQKTTFRKDMLVTGHNLHKMDLFSDDALANLLDQHPSEKLDVCMMPEAGSGDVIFRTGDSRDADGKTLIELVKRGDVWINVREALNIHSDYKKILDQLYNEMSKRTGTKFYNQRGAILISSPTAVVPFHCDSTETMLWHIRGQKQVYVYPETEDYLIETEYETQIANQVHDYLTYHPKMDDAAIVHELQSGEMICWPLNRTHKVVNKSYCVSVTTEYTSFKSVFKNSGVYANAFLRQKFGSNPSWDKAGLPERFIKASMGQVLRRMQAIKSPPNADMVSFRVDKNLPGLIEHVQPYNRNF